MGLCWPGLVKKSYLPEERSRRERKRHLEKRRRHERRTQSSPVTGDVVIINLSPVRKIVVREVACMYLS